MNISEAATKTAEKVLAGTSIGTGVGTPLAISPDKWWIGYTISAITCAAFCVSKWYEARISKRELGQRIRESEMRIARMPIAEDRFS